MFYVFLNIRRRSTKKGGRGSVAHAMSSDVLRVSSRGSARPPVGYAFMPAVGPSVHNAFMQAINAFMQAVNAFMQAGNAFMRSCSMSMCSCRLPDLLVWFSTHCTDANRRETMPKQHMPCTMCSNTYAIQLFSAVGLHIQPVLQSSTSCSFYAVH